MTIPAATGRVVLFTAVMLLNCGCAAMRPLDGIPASRLPDEYRMPLRSGKQLIDLSLLRQTPPPEHRVDSGDVLGIYIEGVLGGPNQSPPVNIPQNPNSEASLGFPVHVRSDGTISLPLTKPIFVRGLTMVEVERKIRAAYTAGKRPVLKAGHDRILVTLQRPRHYRVLVVREEAGNPSDVSGRDGRIAVISSNGKRGMGRTVSLPAYKNDVLHALTETGGLPGLDAQNVIYIIRRRRPSGATPTGVAVPPMPPAPENRPAENGNQNRAAEKGGTKSAAETETPLPILKLSYSTFSPAPRQPAAGDDFEQFGGYSAVPSQSADLSYRRPARSRPVTGSTPSYPSRPVRPTRPVRNHAPPANTGLSPGRRFPGVQRQPRVPVVPTAQQTAAGPSLSPRSTAGRTTLSAGRTTAGTSAVSSSSVVSQRLESARLEGAEIIRIPLRVFPGEPLPFTPQDVILQDGDVVLIESRETDVFFTGGLLGGGRFQLPRDYDIDVLEALAMVQSSQNRNLPTRSVGGIAATNQDVTVGASELIVLRPLPDGDQLAIRVNLYKAMRDPSERIYVRPGDRLVLQYTHLEVWAAIFERHILDGFILGVSSGLFFNN